MLTPLRVEICFGKRSIKANKKAKQNCFVLNVNRKHNNLLLQIDIYVNLVWILVHAFDKNYEIVRMHFGVIHTCRISSVQFSMIII